MNKTLAFFMLLGIIVSACSSKKDEGPLKDFNGHVTEVTSQILKVTDNTGKCITFDNREATYVGGTVMPHDSVCVSYKGKLDSGTPSIIVEFIPKRK